MAGAVVGAVAGVAVLGAAAYLAARRPPWATACLGRMGLAGGEFNEPLFVSQTSFPLT